MELLVALLILLVATRSGGEIAVRLGQPSLVGELLAGVVLGVLAGQIPDLAPRVDDFATSGAFRGVLDLAVFFLLLLAGIEMRPEEVAEASISAFVVAVGGMLVPLVVGFGLGWIYLPDSSAKITQAAFLGIVLAITAVPVSIKMLIDLGQLHSRIGQIIVSAAIFDDVLGLALLATLTAMIGTGVPPTANAFLILGAKVVLFVAAVVALGIFVVPRAGRALRRLRAPESELGMLLIAALAYAVLANALGMHFILGAFAAGLFFGRETVEGETYEQVKSKISGFTTGFLAPIFFASIGFRMELNVFLYVPAFTLILIVAAIASKVVGAGLCAYWSGLGRSEAVAVGIGMSVRGSVALIVADIALRAGLFASPDPPSPIVEHLFSAVVAMAVISTLAAPIVLRRYLSMPP